MLNAPSHTTIFIAELSQILNISVERITERVIALYTEKCCIYVYSQGASRVANHPNLASIHIDEDLILSSKNKVIQRLLGMHGLGERVYARKTVLARIDKKVTLAFLEEYHLQVAMAAKYRYGLFYEGELVSVAVFSGGRLMRDEYEGYRSFELVRFCHKGDKLVVGGLSKLLKAFIQDFNPQDIMTYADLDWTQESSLVQLGFKEVGRLAPIHYYIVDGQRFMQVPKGEENFYCVENSGSLKLKLIL